MIFSLIVFKIQRPLILKLRENEPKKSEELYSDSGVDSMENMFYSIEFRIRDEICHDAKPYRKRAGLPEESHEIGNWRRGATPKRRRAAARRKRAPGVDSSVR